MGQHRALGGVSQGGVSLGDSAGVGLGGVSYFLLGSSICTLDTPHIPTIAFIHDVLSTWNTLPPFLHVDPFFLVQLKCLDCKLT